MDKLKLFPIRDEDYETYTKPRTLYHLTTLEAYEKIQTEGIKPQYGEHCKFFYQRHHGDAVGAFTPTTDTLVYLCEWQHIGIIYQIFKTSNVIIQVDITPNILDKSIKYRTLNYTLRSNPNEFIEVTEYGCSKTITLPQIKNVYNIAIENDTFIITDFTTKEVINRY